MAKQAQQNKLSHRNGVMLEQNTVVDDSLLPPAEELAKLNEVSPGIVDWIKSRTEIEQDARIRFNDGRLGLAKKDVGATHRYNFLSLIFAFLIIVLGMLFSFYLIEQKLETTGTIFAGATIAISAVYFIKASKSSQQKNNK